MLKAKLVYLKDKQFFEKVGTLRLVGKPIETAKKLKLSPRTIEDHLVSAREKTDFISRAKMIDAFLENLIFW